MNKYKKLFKNTSIFFISQFASKLLVFFLLPFYTSYMTSGDYAISDLITTSVSLVFPVFTLSISAATLRFVIEDKENAYSATIFSVRIILVGFVLLLFLFPILNSYDMFNGYEYLFYVFYITSTFDTLFGQLLRAADKIKELGIISVVKTVIIIVMNILLLVVFDKGVIGYIIAYCVAYVFSILSSWMLLSSFLSKSRKGYLKDQNFKKDMLRYSVPMIPNSVSWWLVSAFGKYIIKYVCGAPALGVFSAGSRIPSVLTTVQNVFSEAVVLSVIEEYGNEDENRYFTNIYQFYNVLMVVLCSLLIVFIRIVSKLLLAKEFFGAWTYIPFLLISTVFGALSGYLGTFYNASKNTKGLFVSTLIGGIVSVALNLAFVNIWGVIGASMANLCSFTIIWLYRYIDVKKYVKLDVNIKRDILSYILLITQALLIILLKGYVAYASCLLVFVIIILAYNRETKMLVLLTKKLMKKIIPHKT